MNGYLNAEKRLNEYPNPTDFHDMSVVNMQMLNDGITIRFKLAKHLDNFGILEDDKHLAILEVKYEGTKIVKMNLHGVIYFRDLDVSYFKEINNIMELNLYKDAYDCHFYMHFTYKKYKWKIVDIVTQEEYDNYAAEVAKPYEYLLRAQKFKGPDWANIEE